MATTIDRPGIDTAPRRHRQRRMRRVGQHLSTYAMLAPTVVALAVFFLAPLYYILMFSVGEKQFSQTPALASLNDEATSFTLDLWDQFLGQGMAVNILGAEFGVPLVVVGIVFVLALLGAVFAGRAFGERGALIAAICFVVLLLPFMTLPAGNNLLRVAEFTSDSDYLRLFFRSISLAVTSSVFAVLIAFPVAYYLAFGVQKMKYFWLLIVIAPFLTSYLLRIFAWKVILGDQGLINSGLLTLGVINQPLEFLIYSQFTVIVVLTYAWVPFICLPIFIALENMDRRLLEAATDLGASRWTAFRKITLPIAAPGVVAAFLFVFIPSIGEYITPTLVGGTGGFMFGQAIANQFVGGSINWQFGSVLALFLLLVVLLLTATTARFLRAGGGATT